MSAQPIVPIARNYSLEMNVVIETYTNSGAYSAPTVAAQIIADLEVTDPALLNGWLHAIGQSALTDRINRRAAATRSHMRATASRSVFGAAIQQSGVTGSTAPITAAHASLRSEWTLLDGTKKFLGKCTQEELLSTASRYERDEVSNAKSKMFLRVVAAKVPLGKLVEDVYTDDQLLAMWASLP